MDKNNLSPLEVLTLTIYGEARGESITGQAAVGWIIKNRHLQNPAKYPTYKDVAFAKEQFSCWNEDDPNYSVLMELGEKMILGQEIIDRTLLQCHYLAAGIDSDEIIDPTHGSLYYLTNDLFNSAKKPIWAKNARNTRVIDNQTYFMV